MLPITLTHNDIVYYNINYPILSRGIAEIFCHFRKKTKDLSKSSRKVCNIPRLMKDLSGDINIAVGADDRSCGYSLVPYVSIAVIPACGIDCTPFFDRACVVDLFKRRTSCKGVICKQTEILREADRDNRGAVFKRALLDQLNARAEGQRGKILAIAESSYRYLRYTVRYSYRLKALATRKCPILNPFKS